MSLTVAGRQLRWWVAFLMIGCSVMLLSAAGSYLQAQVVQLRPLANFSFPTRISLSDGAIHVRQKIGLTLGARMSLVFNHRFDVTTAVTYSPGSVTMHGAGKRITLASGAHSLGGSTAARYWLVPATRKLAWEVHTGVGLVFGGQPAYEDLFESSTLSGVLGSTVVYQVGRIVSLKLRLQQRLYRVHFGSGDAGPSKRPLQVTFGLGLPFLESMH